MESKHLLSKLCLITFMLLAGTMARATDFYEYTYAGATLRYTLNNDEAYVGGDTTTASVTEPEHLYHIVPEYIVANGNKYPVTRICQGALVTTTASGQNLGELKSISIPSTVTTLEGGSVDTNLTNLYLGSKISSIGGGAFLSI